MPTLDAIANFARTSGLRKVSVGLYMFTVTSFLIWSKVLPAEQFVQVVTMIVLGTFGGNAAEHAFKRGNDDSKHDSPDDKAKVTPG